MTDIYVSLVVKLAEKDIASLTEAAIEGGVTLRQHVTTILSATAAIYRVEDMEKKPAGPKTPLLRPNRWQGRKWRTARYIDDSPPPDITTNFFGDPPPGRRALNEIPLHTRDDSE